MDKKKLEKKLTIGFQVFAIIGLIIIGFYLGKAYKARRNEAKKEDTIRDFGKNINEFQIDGNTSKYSVKLDGKNIDIENGYILDKTLILYNVGQTGNSIMFFNKDLEEIPFDNKYWTFSKLELVNGKLQTIGYHYEDIMGCRTISNLEICDCTSLDGGDLLIKHKDELETIKDEVVSGTVKLAYDGKEIKTEYVDKETINDIYGKDLEGSTKTYCVKTNN